MTLEQLIALTTSWPCLERPVTLNIGTVTPLCIANPMRWFLRIVPSTLASIRIAKDPQFLAAGGITIANGSEGFVSKVLDAPGETTSQWYGFQSTVGALQVLVYEVVPIGVINPGA